MILELDSAGYFAGPYWRDHGLERAHKVPCARCTTRIAVPCAVFNFRAWSLCPRCALKMISRNREKFEAADPILFGALVTGLASLVKREYCAQRAEMN